MKLAGVQQSVKRWKRWLEFRFFLARFQGTSRKENTGVRREPLGGLTFPPVHKIERLRRTQNMTLAGGDVLARGGKSAAFAGAGGAVTEFENDFIFLGIEELCKKYGLSQAEYDQYAALRLDGTKLPDLKDVDHQETLDVGFTISDHRQNYLSEPTTPAKPVAVQVKKFPEPTYEPKEALMDRLMVMVISDDPNIELLEDGSTRDKRTGLISTARYRQHSNIGIVILSGQWVVVSGVKTPMSELLKPGDKVKYGDYGSEKVDMKDAEAQALCDLIGVDYEKTEQGMRIIRVQDIRYVERRVTKRTGDEIIADMATRGDYVTVVPDDLPRGCEVPNE